MTCRETAAALVAGLLVFVGAAQAGGIASKPSVGPGKYLLELDGQVCGYVSEPEGGHAVADVLLEKRVGNDRPKKHLGKVRYEEVTLAAGTGLCDGFYKWVQDSFGPRTPNNTGRRNGAVVRTDNVLNVLERMTFTNALVTEVGMPALDATSQAAAKMTVKFKPERTSRLKGSGKLAFASNANQQKQWTLGSFRLTGAKRLTTALSNVSKLEALTVKQRVTENPVGDLRDYEKEPASMETPNLVVTVAESHASEFYSWHEDFVVNGNCGDVKEETFAIQYLERTGQTVLFELTLRGAGIFKVAPDKAGTCQTCSRGIKAEMYSEDVKFTYSPAATLR